MPSLLDTIYPKDLESRTCKLAQYFRKGSVDLRIRVNFCFRYDTEYSGCFKGNSKGMGHPFSSFNQEASNRKLSKCLSYLKALIGKI